MQSPFISFRMGVTLAILKAEGTTPVDKDLIKITVSDGERAAAKTLSMAGAMPSGLAPSPGSGQPTGGALSPLLPQ